MLYAGANMQQVSVDRIARDLPNGSFSKPRECVLLVSLKKHPITIKSAILKTNKRVATTPASPAAGRKFCLLVLAS